MWDRDTTFGRKSQVGDLVVASVSAYDSAGNHRLVDGAWTIDSALNSANKGSWYELRPGPIGNFSISATWFDNETSQVHEIEHIVHVEQGELARLSSLKVEQEYHQMES